MTKTNTIHHTTISCGHHRHRVVRTRDGFKTEAATHHDDVDVTVEKLGLAAALGASINEAPGCVALLALLRHGVPYVVDNADMGPWRALWIRYEQNALVRELQQELKRERAARLKPLVDAVLKVLHPIRRGLTRTETRELTTVLPVDQPTDGAIVGDYAEDRWRLPVASNWLDTCATQPVIDGKLVLARSAAGVFVLAHDTDGDAWRVAKLAA